MDGDSQKKNSQPTPILPEPLANATQLKVYTLKELSDKAALAQTLSKHGLDTSSWGSGDTKDVGKFWKEIEGDEAGLEVWKTKSGEVRPVRVTHVLRAKVTSRQSFENNVFLFNTWQQFGDGRKRTRNALLSEKLTISEMPLIDNLRAVCERAVTEEEMQRVVESRCRIDKENPAPVYDKDIACPLNVVDSLFRDHTIEITPSASYPGLLTMYHLYTVDIICSGIPTVDFNTLEFDHEDEKGNRKLKYIHAWVWLEWGQIQRYLFEGSELKDRKTKGAFGSAMAMRDWLSQFDIDLALWGQGQNRSVTDLFHEVQREETQLELWGRHDGVPLLMRVVHVLQIVVYPSEANEDGENRGLGQKHLLQTWQESPSGEVKAVHRVMAKKLSTSMLPFDEARFKDAADKAVRAQLSFFLDPASAKVDVASKNDSVKKLMRQSTDVWSPTSASTELKIGDMQFLDQRFDLEESPSYKGMHTMYNLYTVQVAVEGLPETDFNSLDFERAETFGKAKPYRLGWRWVSWMESMDLVHGKASALERRESERMKQVSQSALSVAKLKAVVSRMSATSAPKEKEEVNALLAELQSTFREMQTPAKKDDALSSFLPPSMVSKLKEGASASLSSAFDHRSSRVATCRPTITTTSERDHGGEPVERLVIDNSARGPWWCGGCSSEPK